MKKAFLLVALLYCLSFMTNAQDTIKHSSQVESNTTKKVYVEGKVLHVCPVSGDKLKLQLADGKTITILPFGEEKKFDYSLNGKNIVVFGTLDEVRLQKTTIDSNYNQQKLLCHVDCSPCTDSVWADGMWQKGYAKEMLESKNAQLQSRMTETGKDYVRLYSMHAVSISVIE